MHEQVNFINKRIKALWECPDQDEEVGTKHVPNTERFQTASREPVPPLANEPRELIDLDDDLREDPTIDSLSSVDTTKAMVEESSQRDEDDNDVVILIVM